MTKEEDERRLERLKNIVSSMPGQPGSYQFYDEKGTVIYVGKAKSLKSRVSSYFHGEVDRFKTKVLVSKIQDITYTIVKTEEDALLLENSLIKKYTPRYNVLLKDGKTYPSICVTDELYPRIFKTRTINKRWGTYYGPYSNVGSMSEMLRLIRKLYAPRTCRYPLTEEDVSQGKYKVCLEYHIKNCGGPCAGCQSMEDYTQKISQAREILKGNTRGLLREMREKMRELSEDMRFEEAERIKHEYILIENFRSKSEVVSHTIDNTEVYTITSDDKTAFINYMHVKSGSINQSYTFEYKKRLDESDAELLVLGIVEMRDRFKSNSAEIILPMPVDLPINGIVITVPQRGDKKTLLELSLMNCKQYRVDKLKQTEKLNPEQRKVRLMKEIQEHLRLPKMPYHIECFDNSNISGTDAVAACVVFKKLKPSKKEYRKYNIRTVLGPNDYASMQEVVRRRYTRLLEEGSPLPDLIITDGGKGQMEVVREVIEDELHVTIPIAGLVKDGHHRTSELLYGFPAVTIGMKPDSELFKVLNNIQDEVHRFAITFHRDKRSKHALHSELDDIKGIGPKTKDALLTKFKTVRKIKNADIQDIIEVIGPSRANLLEEYFSRHDSNAGTNEKREGTEPK